MNRIPVLLKAQFAMLAVASIACSAVVLVAGDRGVESVPFAIPAVAAADSTWTDDVNRFAKRLHKALGVPRSTAAEFSGWILEASTRQGVSPELLASVVFTESGFRKTARSLSGAVGPAQIMPVWGVFCGSGNLADPAENIYCAAQILAHLREQCGTEKCALAAYNVGLKNRQDGDYFEEQGLRYARTVDRHASRLTRTAL